MSSVNGRQFAGLVESKTSSATLNKSSLCNAGLHASLKLLHQMSPCQRLLLVLIQVQVRPPSVGLAVNHKDAFIPDPGGCFRFHYCLCSLLLELESLNSWMEATFTHLGNPQQVALLKAGGTFFLWLTSRQQTQAGDLGGEERVQDEDDGLWTGVQVQLLEGGKENLERTLWCIIRLH